jgi:hypothetical protein
MMQFKLEPMGIMVEVHQDEYTPELVWVVYDRGGKLEVACHDIFKKDLFEHLEAMYNQFAFITVVD